MTATPANLLPAVEVRHLGRAGYDPVWQAMRDLTARRDAAASDEIWLVEHSPVYTLGVAARAQHLPRFDNGIPVVKTDRGGQITYHGPGQLVAYLLLDLRRRALSVRPLVTLMEQAIVNLLAEYNIEATARRNAPGVYVGNAKVAALGLRIRRGCCYHGLALNVDMDLRPFAAIDPCGYPGLAVTQLRDLGVSDGLDTVGARLTQHLLQQLNA
ncbi:MAG TPA: lipoyl(octanoyl) transferase LipB [Burkholderiales bacterium]|nr:lipoyl(octanoyl) transferase LipB [Burkholderiales bacterium]